MFQLRIIHRLTIATVLGLSAATPSALATTADAAYLLSSPQESISARVELIAASKQPFISVFEIADDEIGLVQLSALIDSANAGGHPRLLVDAVGNKISRDMLSYVASQNVEIKVFDALRAGAFLKSGTRAILQRMHDKLLTNGNGELITGGRNLLNPYFGLNAQGKNFIDYDVVVNGHAADDARAYQEQLWVSPMAFAARPSRLSKTRQTAMRSQLAQAVTTLKRNRWLKNSTFQVLPLLMPVQVSFIHDVISTRGPSGGAERALITLLANAQHEVLIDSQFLLLTPDIASALKAASARGVAITIVTNGQKAYQVGADRLTQDAFELSKPLLSGLGITVREYEGPGKIHSKEVVADRTSCLIWSFNLDPRSRYINYEAGVRIVSPSLCGELATSMLAHFAVSQLTIDSGHEMVPVREISRAHRALINGLYKEL